MKKRYKILEPWQLYKAEHDELGIWYFTTPYTLIDFCDISYSSFYNMLMGRAPSVRGWKITIVDKEGIPTNLIDQK